MTYNGALEIHSDDHFLNVNFVPVHEYGLSSDFISSKAVSVAGRLHAQFS